jgi:hypothetical protein
MVAAGRIAFRLLRFEDVGALDQRVHFSEFGAPQAPGNILRKAKLGAHPSLVLGALALKCPSQVLRRQLRPIPKKVHPFSEILDICGAQLAPGMKCQNVLRWFSSDG